MAKESMARRFHQARVAADTLPRGEVGQQSAQVVADLAAQTDGLVAALEGRGDLVPANVVIGHLVALRWALVNAENLRRRLADEPADGPEPAEGPTEMIVPDRFDWSPAA